MAVYQDASKSIDCKVQKEGRSARQWHVSREGREGGEGRKPFPSVLLASFARRKKLFRTTPLQTQTDVDTSAMQV